MWISRLSGGPRQLGQSKPAQYLLRAGWRRLLEQAEKRAVAYALNIEADRQSNRLAYPRTRLRFQHQSELLHAHGRRADVLVELHRDSLANAKAVGVLVEPRSVALRGNLDHALSDCLDLTGRDRSSPISDTRW